MNALGVRRLGPILLVALLAGCVAAGGAPRTTASVWRKLSAEEVARLDAARQEALERRASGEAVAWRAEGSGRSGTVVPLWTFKVADGRYCRDYRETVVVAGRERERIGRACREASGLWRTVPVRA